ncbi:SNF2 family N-terminal domain-containing protein [Phaeosphaeriaceae sp. PMI808]|nr:SNF2 family N-terminal domain-containing protein [Phaeosphaeriaceae sp. PMI808]
MTFELQTHSADVAITHLKHSDTLDAFITSRQLGELASPSGLRTQLLPHQRQALYFMAQRELGWALGGASYDLWTELEDNCQTIYRNNITGAMHFCKPTQFKGGILADSMGLGKSCSIIALLVHDSDKHREDPNAPNLGTRNVSATLLIVPPTLLQTWEEQLQKHLRDVALLKVRRHHGSSRISTIDEARSCGLVITTYQTVETEWRAGMVSESSLLFSVNWQRIVLDEAHYVSNHQSNTAQAVCNLEARARWAVTGTPLQNRLGDIATLCQFLRVYPYNSRETFNRDIVNPWKAGNNEVAITRLKTLLQCILLRRSQGTVELPKRTDLKFTLQLSREERKHYEKVESCAARSVDAALHDTKSSGKAFASIIQQINELRLVCNLGTRRKPPRQATTQPDIIWDSPTAQKAMDAMAATESMSCTSCGLILDTVGLDNSLGMELSAASSRFWLFSCLSIVCEGCMRRNPMTRCGCVSFCSRAVVIHTPEKIASASSPPAESPSDIDEEPLPTKVQALIRDLLEQAPGVKSIVFTFWSSTLDLVAKGLSQASVMYTRYDGNTTPANRSLALKSFRKNPGISVILMTISCAAVGLDITAASRAYILEPQWNPTVEEQALARVHRMGQTKEVTTIRLVMADTFEERVVETQQRKKELAELLLAPEQHTEPEHSLDRLRYFRSLLK